MNNTIEIIRNNLENASTRSAWAKGVKAYAFELLENLEEGLDGGWYYEEDIMSPKLLRKMLLNGAENWKQFSWGGSSLIYDCDIAERLCTPSELKKTRYGERKPNHSEDWLDVQARALYQAEFAIKKAILDAVTKQTL